VFKAKAKLDVEDYYVRLATQAEEGVRQNNLRLIYRVIRELRENFSGIATDSAPVAKKDGLLCNSAQELLERGREYCQELLNHEFVTTCWQNNLCVIREPISAALHILFTKVWITCKVSADWRNAIVISPHKGKEFKSNCASYRFIYISVVCIRQSVRSCYPREITTTATSTTAPTAVWIHSWSLNGRCYSCSAASVRVVQKIFKPLYMAYVDIKAAFDSVDKKAL